MLRIEHATAETICELAWDYKERAQLGKQTGDARSSGIEKEKQCQ